MTEDEDRTARTDRIERGVLARIEWREARRTAALRGATAVVLLGLVVGGIAALRPSFGGSASTSGSAGGSAASAASSAQASSDAGRNQTLPAGPNVVLHCHRTSAAGSPVRITAVGGLVESAVATLCAEAFARATVPVVLCGTSGSPVEVFPADDRPSTLCSRNGLPSVR